ncbi:protein-L-isoaspartate O-methyltransferase [Ahrensia sp. R2A130]|uniref:protein-L-isoaspartate O-methyltransferase family protein n=1 Tax=Ahrensia sp. R2A130 TaxID=744979 RepID=UPI00059039E8|nr:protein-L-isoaspartate O-methyltransferase [Ahrensia sp. R2A130]
MTMVDCQIRPNDVTDRTILQAFMDVPREAFVSAAQKPLAYIDEDIPVSSDGDDRYLMEVTSMAKLVQLAEIKPDSIVLDIGCATGYSTAILSRLCNSVVAVESDEHLAQRAGESLIEGGFDNAVVVHGPLEKGLPKEGPYDVIYIGGAVSELPDVLTGQLKEGGRLVVVEGTGNAGVARLYTRNGDTLSGRRAFNSAVKPLPGFEAKPGFVF